MEQIDPQLLSLHFDRLSGALNAEFNPKAGVPAPNISALKQAIANSSFSKLYIDEAALKDFAGKAAIAKEAISHKIGERRDGEFALEISADMMSVYLSLSPPDGGRAKALEVLNDIRARGIVHGIMHEKLRSAISAGSCTKLLIAQGTPPVQGEPAHFESLLDAGKNAQEEGEDAEEEEDDDDAIISYADLSHMLLIHVGEAVMRRIPTSVGLPGMNVKGEDVLPAPVPEVTFNKDCSGTEISADNPDLLIAAIAGQPALINNGVRINPVVTVEDVDLSTGNIDFPGTVKVKGDVKTGMRLRVTGDIFVQGTVEAADLEAGGNIFVTGGIIGLSETQAGATPAQASRIKCGGTVQALFAESAVIEAGDSIMIAGNARLCEMRAGNQIIVGKTNPKLGQIIGGRAQATMLIKAIGMGAPTGNLTKIQVGLDPYLEEKLHATELEFQKKLDELDRIVKQMGYYKQHPEKVKEGQIEETELNRKLVAQQIKDLVVLQAEMKEELIAADAASIVVIKSVFEGVEMRIGRQVWQVLSNLGGGTAHLQGGRIAFGK